MSHGGSEVHVACIGGACHIMVGIMDVVEHSLIISCFCYNLISKELNSVENVLENVGFWQHICKFCNEHTYVLQEIALTNCVCTVHIFSRQRILLRD